MRIGHRGNHDGTGLDRLCVGIRLRHDVDACLLHCLLCIRQHVAQNRLQSPLINGADIKDRGEVVVPVANRCEQRDGGDGRLGKQAG